MTQLIVLFVKNQLGHQAAKLSKKKSPHAAVYNKASPTGWGYEEVNYYQTDPVVPGFVHALSYELRKRHKSLPTSCKG